MPDRSLWVPQRGAPGTCGGAGGVAAGDEALGSSELLFCAQTHLLNPESSHLAGSPGDHLLSVTDNIMARPCVQALGKMQKIATDSRVRRTWALGRLGAFRLGEAPGASSTHACVGPGPPACVGLSPPLDVLCLCVKYGSPRPAHILPWDPSWMGSAVQCGTAVLPVSTTFHGSVLALRRPERKGSSRNTREQRGAGPGTLALGGCSVLCLHEERG